MFLVRNASEFMVYGLVQTINKSIVDKPGTAVHYSVFPVTAGGDYRVPTTTQLLVSAVAPTDLPTAIVVGNALRTVSLAHVKDQLDGYNAGAHIVATLAADTTFTTLCGTTITNLSTLDAFLVGFKTWGAAHAAATSVHPNADSGAHVAALAGGTILSNSNIGTAITFIALAVAFINAHVALTHEDSHQIRLIGP